MQFFSQTHFVFEGSGCFMVTTYNQSENILENVSNPASISNEIFQNIIALYNRMMI